MLTITTDQHKSEYWDMMDKIRRKANGAVFKDGEVDAAKTFVNSFAKLHQSESASATRVLITIDKFAEDKKELRKLILANNLLDAKPNIKMLTESKE